MRMTLWLVALIAPAAIASAPVSSAATRQRAVPLHIQNEIKRRVPGYLRYVPTKLPAHSSFRSWSYLPKSAHRRNALVIRFSTQIRPDDTASLVYIVGEHPCSYYRPTGKKYRFPGHVVPLVYSRGNIHVDVNVWGCARHRGTRVPIRISSVGVPPRSLAGAVALSRRLG